ncbi:MAG: HDIG domain-containing protein [Paramuribaculum sp.]|nr:HDIG domain-containing protein [Paramuribaculum sp.]
MDYQSIIDKYYPAGSPLRDIYMRHCHAVASKALSIAKDSHLAIDPKIIEAAAMLHDIGIFATNAPGIECHGTEPYIRHGIIGAEILRAENIDEEIAATAELHTGAGITLREIVAQNLPLPHKDFCPRTQLQRLVCYADKFYSKSGDMKRKDFERARASLARISEESAERFDSLHKEFSEN